MTVLSPASCVIEPVSVVASMPKSKTIVCADAPSKVVAMPALVDSSGSMLPSVSLSRVSSQPGQRSQASGVVS